MFSNANAAQQCTVVRRVERRDQLSRTTSLDDRNSSTIVHLYIADVKSREMRLNGFGLGCGTNNHHPDPHVKRAEHLFFIDVAETLHQAEDGEFGPGAAIYFDGDAVGQDAGNVFEEAAADDMDEAFDDAGVEKAFEWAEEAGVSCEQS